MKCKNCDGNGGYFYMNRWCFCEQCDGTGQDGLSNDEWRKTCSTEEFAEWISNLAYACMRCGMSNGEAYCHTGHCIQDKEDALLWLKQPHTI